MLVFISAEGVVFALLGKTASLFICLGLNFQVCSVASGNISHIVPQCLRCQVETAPCGVVRVVDQVHDRAHTVDIRNLWVAESASSTVKGCPLEQVQDFVWRCQLYVYSCQGSLYDLELLGQVFD